MSLRTFSTEEYQALFPQPELDSSITRGRFDGKVVIVTGGSSGIGRATVDRFSNDGASVAIFARDQERGEVVVREFQSQGRKVKFYQVDIANRERCVEAARNVADDNGGEIHYLVNNAGVLPEDAIKNIAEVPMEAFDKLMSTNVLGTANMVQACFPHMKNGDQCSVVNVSSGWGNYAVLNTATFCTSAGAIKMLTKCMALDLSKSGIRVNCVSPGYTWTPGTRILVESKEKGNQAAELCHMTGRMIEAAGIASVIAFLCSKDAMYIDGADIPVDCGMVAMGPEARGKK